MITGGQRTLYFKQQSIGSASAAHSTSQIILTRISCENAYSRCWQWIMSRLGCVCTQTWISIPMKGLEGTEYIHQRDAEGGVRVSIPQRVWSDRSSSGLHCRSEVSISPQGFFCCSLKNGGESAISTMFQSLLRDFLVATKIAGTVTVQERCFNLYTGILLLHTLLSQLIDIYTDVSIPKKGQRIRYDSRKRITQYCHIVSIPAQDSFTSSIAQSRRCVHLLVSIPTQGFFYCNDSPVCDVEPLFKFQSLRRDFFCNHGGGGMGAVGVRVSIPTQGFFRCNDIVRQHPSATMQFQSLHRDFFVAIIGFYDRSIPSPVSQSLHRDFLVAT